MHPQPNLFLYEADGADKGHLRCPQVVRLRSSHNHMFVGTWIEEMAGYKGETLAVKLEVESFMIKCSYMSRI